MMKLRKGCHALIVALVMAICCNFIAFGDEVAAPADAVESVMDDTADDSSVSESTDSETDEAAEPDSDSEPDGSETEDAPESDKKDDNQSSFDSGNKEDHSSFDEWDFPEPTPEPQPEPQPEPAPEPTPEPEKPEPEVPVVPEPEKPEIPVVPVVPEPEKPVTPEPTPEPERWHDDDDDDDDTIVVIPKMPVITTGTDEVPVIKTFEVSSGDTLPTPEEPVVTTEKASSSELPKTGDSSLALYAFLASAFGLVVLLASSLLDRHNADETAKEVPAYPQMCCGPQETKETGKDVSVKAARSSGTKIAPSRFGLRCKNCIEIVLALTHPGWGLFVSKSR